MVSKESCQMYKGKSVVTPRAKPDILKHDGGTVMWKVGFI